MRRKGTILLFTLLCMFTTSVSVGQYDNSPFLHHLPHDSSRTKSVFLSLESLSFLKNNEYGSYIADGYTLFGFQVLPYFTYQARSNIRVNAGVYLQKDFGNRDFSTIEPYFSVKVSHKNFHVVFGNLEGSLNHKLIEPLYDFERVLNDRQEFGLQFLLTRPNFFSDVWVNWENMIYKGDPEQEEITGGLSIMKSFNLSDNFRIGIPLQMTIYHRGGQIDSSPNLLLTRVNAAGGIDLKLSLGNLLKSIGGSVYYIHSINDDPNPSTGASIPDPGFSFFPQYPVATKGDTLVYGDGKGFFANLGFNVKHNIQLMASFWIADNFASPRGGQLYPSESSSFKEAGLIVNRRTLLIGRVFHDWEISEYATFSTRIEPYWDLNTNAFEYAFGFYLNFRPEFFIWKAK